MKFTHLVPLALLPLSLALPSPANPAHTIRATIEQITDTLLFTNTMAQFQAARNAQNPSSLDWSSDGCSDSPDNPLGFKFTPSCQRHDFGYRNYKAQGRFTSANKAKIDTNFHNDLDNYCATVSDFEEGACKALADVYYEAVKEFGSKRKVRREDGTWVYLEFDEE